ncbi:MAG: GNAT family N-acetyltransferase [Thermoplasmatota archaeon]
MDPAGFKGLRTRYKLEPGDLESILDLHIEVYEREHGYNSGFGDYVKRTLDEFRREHTKREKVWIIEEGGDLVGCLAVVERSDNTAQLRWFLVHPFYRGKGLGTRMFKEAMEFIKDKEYKKAYLTTQNILEDAAGIYRDQGFELVWEGEEERTWGVPSREQRYERKIRT